MYPSERSKQQAFSTVFKSYNGRKGEDELGQSVLKSNSSQVGKFFTDIRKKYIIISLSDFHLPTWNWVYFPESTYYLLFKIF